MDDLLAKASNLTVLDEDGWEINEAVGDVAGGHCAKGRFCSNKPMSRPLLKTILGRVWGIADKKWGVEIKHSNKQSSFLVFTFKSAQDLNRILGKNPWFLNYGTLILEREVIDVQMADIPRIVTKDFFTFKGMILEFVQKLPRCLKMNEKCPALNVEEGSSNNKQRTVLGVEVPAAINKSPGKMADVNSGFQVNCKRNGSWRNDHESLKGFAAMDMEREFDSEGLRKSRPGEEVDYNNLVEIPISYDVGIESPILKAWWKFIWSSKLIPKMKNFIWRVFNQWIPTKIELSKRGMSLETTCDWCHEIEEDICHALWFCPKVLKIWKLAGFDTQNFIHMLKAPDLLFYLWGKLPKEEMLQFIGLSWLIWQRRNKLIFKHQAQEIHSWVRWALEKLDDYFEESKHSRQDRVVKANQKWGPPPIDCVMINTDASLIVDKLGCGLSAVIRDSAGDLIVVETVFLPGIASVYLAEAAAVHLGIGAC
ncbi:hypothetical protein F8388_001878 [Cannabis sativa]|uniref:Reverse transcriptase zinc-binding domain-containing protein n=1 Tax=Cannabis sativa TaxID=3483 RepID=A0A7J6FFH6_CANSA|nr:hypothetical protein F8388_001878 [Cannabis sativa]